MTNASIFAPLDWFISTQGKLETARTRKQLEDCKGLLDSHEMLELPEHRQTYLCTLFSEAYFRITGAGTP